MKEFEEKIGYTFKDKTTLTLALTHSSYANENKKSNEYNERLEFLGDAVLQVVVSEKLYTNNPNMPEGDMSKNRASLVCEEALSNYSKKIELGKWLLLGKGEETQGARNRPSTLADAFEAVVGAIFLDGGIDKAKQFILKCLDDSSIKVKDYKTILQEVIQRKQGDKLNYVMQGEKGPDHNKSFKVKVFLNDKDIGTGSGKSKKQAEQEAAKNALSFLGESYE